MDSFIRAENVFDDWPMEMRIESAVQRFVPTVERIIEAQHRFIKKSAGYNRAGPIVAATAIRGSHVLEKMVAREPEAYDELAKRLLECNSIRT